MRDCRPALLLREYNHVNSKTILSLQRPCPGTSSPLRESFVSHSRVKGHPRDQSRSVRWREWDSNPRLQDYETCELPLLYPAALSIPVYFLFPKAFLQAFALLFKILLDEGFSVFRLDPYVVTTTSYVVRIGIVVAEFCHFIQANV